MGNTDKFDMLANQYDSSERIQIAKLSSDAIRDYLVNTQTKDAIDFGCGTGLVGMNLLDKFKSILFLDTSQNMLNIVTKKIYESNIVNASTMCFDFETSQHTNIHADYIFMVFVLLHIKDYVSILTKLHDVLNIEGHLIIVDFIKNEKVASDLVHNGFELNALNETMAKIGFNKIQSKTFYSGSNLFMGQEASLFILDAIKS